jgi:hypothetical protein
LLVLMIIPEGVCVLMGWGECKLFWATLPEPLFRFQNQNKFIEI